MATSVGGLQRISSEAFSGAGSASSAVAIGAGVAGGGGGPPQASAARESAGTTTQTRTRWARERSIAGCYAEPRRAGTRAPPCFEAYSPADEPDDRDAGAG